MKKILAGFLIGALLAVPAYADVDYSEIFDGMTLEDMKDLYEETGRRIEALEKASVDADLNEDGTENKSIWTAKYYVDEFNQPTEDGYVTNKEYFVGTFSNSATTDSLLKAQLLLDDKVAFKLYEYGSQIVKGYHSKGDVYIINVLSPSGEKYEMRGTLLNGNDRIFLSESYVSTFFDILNENGEVRISMKEKDGTSSYFFVIQESSGLEETYLQLFDKVPHYSTGESDEIAVTMSVELSYDNEYTYKGYEERIYINIKTNLPDDIVLYCVASVPLEDDKSIATGTIKDGMCNVRFPETIDAKGYVNIIIRYGQITDEQKQLYGDSLEKFTGEISDDMKTKSGHRIQFKL